MAFLWWNQAPDYYAQIPDMKHKTYLPNGGFGFRPMRVTREGHVLLVRCRSKDETKSLPQLRKHPDTFAHRLMAWCACGREIPVGRLGQHAKACNELQAHTALQVDMPATLARHEL